MDAKIAELFAKQEITEILYRYCRAMDRMDKPLALSIWHPGATVDYGSTYKGDVPGFIEAAWAIHSSMICHSHQITNILIATDLEANQAQSEAYAIAALRYTDEKDQTVQLTVRVRYLDRLSMKNGQWAIDHRLVVHDFSDVCVVEDSSVPAEGRRDGEDPSYLFLKSGVL